MAICSFCGNEMLTTPSCAPCEFANAPGVLPVRFGFERYHEITRWHCENHPNDRCPDCGVLPGGYHHPHCDMEEHPILREQAIMFERRHEVVQ